MFNGHVDYATNMLTKAYAGIPVTPEEHSLYEKSVGYMNTIHDSGVRTPEMVRVMLEHFRFHCEILRQVGFKLLILINALSQE